MKMEFLGLIELPTWLAVILVFISTVTIYSLWKRSTFTRLGLKTKPCKILLGDFADMGKKGLGMYDVELVNTYGKLFGTFWGNQPVMVISDTDMIKEICVKKFSNFTDRFTFSTRDHDMNFSVTSARGHHWKYLRTRLTPCFSTGKVKNTKGIVENCLTKLHKNLEEQMKSNPDGFDIYYYFTAFTLDVICSTGFGIDVDSQGNPENEFVKKAKKFMGSSFSSNIGVIFKAMFPDMPFLHLLDVKQIPPEAIEYFKGVTTGLMQERKSSSQSHHDILQTMISTQSKKTDDITELGPFERSALSYEDMRQTGLADMEIILNSMMFMMAGFDTTAATLGWLAYELAVNQSCQDKLIQEIQSHIGKDDVTYEAVNKLEYLDLVIKETVRVHPIGHGMLRQAKDDCDICGVRIPKDMWILVSADAMHYMPQYWDNPEHFSPERFSAKNADKLEEYAYMPFGIGPRNCIGKRLAMFEIKYAIVSILQKYRIVKGKGLQVPLKGSIKGILKPDEPVLVKLVDHNVKE